MSLVLYAIMENFSQLHDLVKTNLLPRRKQYLFEISNLKENDLSCMMINGDTLRGGRFDLKTKAICDPNAQN